LQLAVDHLPAAAAVPTTATAAEFTPDTRLVPAAAAAWLGMWLASSGAAWALVLHAALVAVTVVVALQRRSWQAVAVTLVLSGCLVAGGLRAWQLAHGPVAELAEARAVVALEVEVTGEPRLVVGGVGGPATYVPADVVAVEGRGRSWALRQPVVVRGGAAWAGVTVGSRLALSGRLAEADDGRAEAALVHSLGEPRVLGPPPLCGGIERIRQGLRAAVAGTTPERAALVPALVVGDTSSMTPELQADFRVTGLTHLTAVSGANLTLLLVFVTTVARAVGARGRALTGLAVVSVVAFVALCRSEPSVLRAAAMGLVGLAALGRTPAAGSGVRNLAVLVLCWVDPGSAGRGVHALGGGLRRHPVVGPAPGPALRRWLPAWLADSVAVPLALSWPRSRWLRPSPARSVSPGWWPTCWPPLRRAGDRPGPGRRPGVAGESFRRLPRGLVCRLGCRGHPAGRPRMALFPAPPLRSPRHPRRGRVLAASVAAARWPDAGWRGRSSSSAASRRWCWP
jgi:competence protein ComEC